ncbi:MAG: hypothetical protein KDJ50_03680 [Alphaproteobacteria bacterium]|nr:hypothetical protein [Alphaproteobacteria bacterium]
MIEVYANSTNSDLILRGLDALSAPSDANMMERGLDELQRQPLKSPIKLNCNGIPVTLEGATYGEALETFNGQSPSAGLKNSVQMKH